MSNEAEAAVRRYLAYLDDPSSVVDQDLVRAAEEAVAAAPDPLAKLHAAADLERARAADPGDIEDDFVRHAKAYAEAEDIPAEAFVAVGVPGDVLERAGIGEPRTRRRGGRRASAAPRAPQVPVSQIKAAVSQLPKRFTLAQVAEAPAAGLRPPSARPWRS
ncbi:MAG: hypothetical protein R2702_12885 [Acidimicrobiales bacterium]